MYVPTSFAMSDDEVRRLLRDHGAGELVTFAPGPGLLATLVPFVYEPASDAFGSLHGHLARNNDQWRHEPVGEALVVLRGPDGYVSPAWYETKRENARVVPTWNYVTAHVYGRLVVHDDVDYVRGVVERLTVKHESGRDDPWSVQDAPARYVDGLLRAVVGVEVRISRVEAKAKLSQNRSADDVEGVIRGLELAGHDALAAAVRDRRGPG